MNAGLRQVLGNFGKLLSGKAAGGVLSLFYLMIVTRALGAAGFGTLSLVHGYVTFIGGVVAFSGFHGVVHYGAEALARGEHGRLLRLIRLSSLVEAACGLAAIGLAAALVPLVGPHLHWSPAAMSMAVPYSLAVLATVRATPQGILQLANRFDLIGWHQTVMPVARLIGTLVAWGCGAGLRGFLVVWLVSALAEGAAMWLMALAVLRGMRLRGGLRAGLRGGLAGIGVENPGLARFMLSANANISLRELSPNLAPLTVGWMMGPAAAGLLALAQRASNVLQQPAVLLGQAIFSVLAGHHAERDWRELGSTVKRSVWLATLAALPVLLVLSLFGPSLLHLLGGRGFKHLEGGVLLLTLLAVARLIRFASQPLVAALTATGRPGKAMRVSVLAELALYPLLPLLLWRCGVVGAGWQALMQASLSFWLWRRSFRRWLRRRAVEEAIASPAASDAALPEAAQADAVAGPPLRRVATI
ncbi:lipopolysaccharide biosynthesis protein [Rhizosaccharibacter radicis]|uniref:MATE family efflux transporter n=1 Tax=Rhizosaccharibacter radicis TaxID=2782605 RepID=A0ABT1VZU3_9PROT|nr:MATE family efflux transporter [Acetobacteraceae bacterium KSS12]